MSSKSTKNSNGSNEYNSSMITDEDAGTTAASEVSREFPKHHPAGLWVLFTTEMWERFCYYGMRAFLVLYLVSKSTADNPGLGWTEKDAYGLYGIFTGLVYLMPLLGGWVADRFIGPHRSVFWGGVIMAIGEFTLAATEFCRQGAGIPVNFKDDPVGMLTFFIGLTLMIVGTGFFKPCISVMVGQLYGKDDPRRDGAFTIFYMGINLGAMLAPLIAGTIAEKIGYSYGFMTAGVGMIIGLITYSSLRPFYLSSIGLAPQKIGDAEVKTEAQKEAVRVAEFERTRPLTRVDYDRMFVIGILVFFTIAFWTAFEQAGSTLNLFAKKETDRRVPSAITRLIPESFSPMLSNEFAKDLKEAINEMDQIHANVADLLQKTSQLRKEEKEKKNEKAKEKQKKRQEKIAEKGYFKLVWEEFQQKDKFLFDKDDNEIPINSLIKELLNSVEKLVVKERIEFAGQPNTVENDSSSNDDALSPLSLGVIKSPIKIVPRTETLKLHDEIASKVPEGTALPDRKDEEPDEFRVEPNTISQHVLYLVGYKLDKDDLDSLLGELKKYPKAKKNLEDMLTRANTLYDPQIGKVTTFPATWYQSVNAFGIVIFAPMFAFMWVYLAGRGIQPSTPVKFGIGLLLLSTSFVVMVPGAIQSANSSGLAGAYWLLLSYMLATWGELCLSPVGLSMVTKLSPVRYASLLMGVWFLSSAFANYLSGALAAWFGTSEDGSSPLSIIYGSKGGMADFFVIMALIPAVAGIIVLCLSPILKKMMHGIK